MEIKMKPDSVIEARLGLQNGGPAHKFFTQTCAKAMDKYVPKDEGNLRINTDIQTDSITYQSPYARYQYHGMRADGTHVVKKYTTPGTGPYWDQRMWSAESEDIIQQVQKFVENGGK